MRLSVPPCTTKHNGPATLVALALAGVGFASASAQAAQQPPIKIGVIAEASSVAGGSIIPAARLAADQINAKGGIDGRKVQIFAFDDHSSAADATRAYQRAVGQDHVNAVIATFMSEVALALEPWSARLHMPTLTVGAASTRITHIVHDDYARYKYTFQGWINSSLEAQTACSWMHGLLFKPYHMKAAVILSEDADWTKPFDKALEACLPTVGVKVLDQIRYSPNTTDFTPIFNKIEGEHPQIIVAGMGHTGVQPVAQWASEQVPIPIVGEIDQATNTTFWKDTNGAANGVMAIAAGAPGVAVTKKTVPFIQSYVKQYGAAPSYTGFVAFDEVHIIANAVSRAGSTDPDKMVAALEGTDYTGVMGRDQFYGKDSPFTHGLKAGNGLVTGIVIQWQNGKQVCVWPANVCKGTLKFPAFIKLDPAASR